MKKKSRPATVMLLTAALVVLGVLVIFRMESPQPSVSPPTSSGSVQTIEPTPSPSPTPKPTPTPDPILARAEELLAEMSDWEKICQMFIVYPEAVGTVTGAEESMMEGLAKYPVGGFVFSAKNLGAGRDDTIATIRKMQDWSKLGLIISADEEGGRVNRLMTVLNTTWVGSMYSYKDKGIQTAYDNAATIARDLKTYGFNTDFAPVADVFSNPVNTVIGDRAYSDDFTQAAELVESAVKGFKDNGVLCTVKHFPGHGDTVEDSHDSAAIVTKALSELEKQEFMPFIRGINAGADMVMIGHLTIPSLDPEPATVSFSIVTGLLRDRLGYNGVVITDSLEMGAITGYETGQLAARAVSAGIDILLGPDDLPKAIEGIERAIAMGELAIERIDESVMRILKMKLENGIIE